jgi:hypothetical protein
MKNFEEFLKKHGPAIDCQPADSKTISAYKKQLPAELIELWQTSGFCGYAKGFLWVVNPAQLQDVMKDWFPGDKTVRIPILRTAFGDVIFWDKQGAHVLRVQHGHVHDIVNDVSVLFWYWLCDDGVLKKVLDHGRFAKALKKYGPVRADECYAFKLALALGGHDNVNNMAKVKLREQLSILSQLVED